MFKSPISRDIKIARSSRSASFTRAEVLKWNENKTVNPKTGYKIKKGGPIYNSLVDAAHNFDISLNDGVFSKPKSASSSKWEISNFEKNTTPLSSKKGLTDEEICQAFIKNPSFNPVTGRAIKYNSRLYKHYFNKCIMPLRPFDDDDEIFKTPPKKSPSRRKSPRKSPTRQKSPSRRKSPKRTSQSDCNEFEKNPSVNPKTGRKIKRGGPTYKKYLKDCDIRESDLPSGSKSPSPSSSKRKAHKKPTNKDCEDFHKNPRVNPITGRKIKLNKAVHKQLVKDCKSTSPSPRRSPSKRKSPTKSKSPTPRRSPSPRHKPTTTKKTTQRRHPSPQQPPTTPKTGTTRQHPGKQKHPNTT